MAKMNIIQARKIVTIAYELILDRSPDKSGLNYWANKLSSGEINENDLIYSFVTSNEYQNNKKKRMVK